MEVQFCGNNKRRSIFIGEIQLMTLTNWARYHRLKQRTVSGVNCFFFYETWKVWKLNNKIDNPKGFYYFIYFYRFFYTDVIFLDKEKKTIKNIHLFGGGLRS